MDEGLVGIVEAGEAQRLATGFVFTEGPLWVPEGYWLFDDVRTSHVYKVVPGGEAEVVRENSDQSNGMAYDLHGRIMVCEMESRQVQRWEADGSLTPIATHWDGKRLNRPNDVICASDGSVYFTDPGIRMEEHEKELDFFGVYRLSPDGDLQPIIRDFEFPNGLALSPDEKTLYVANTRPDMHIRAFDVQPDGTVANGRVFAELVSDAPEGAPDGMKVDTEGRVFCTGPGGCWVYSPDGEHLGTIVLPEVPANCGFGGDDYRTLFFTARTSVYSVRVTTPGIRPPGTP
ncbi:MAG: SMP-30/gluconolactonase/LRE family protein [Chloroflexi bacterium]|nr:SMP-30/gluconolactonase/LRE family protein [Chloroflexota bacterium]